MKLKSLVTALLLVAGIMWPQPSQAAVELTAWHGHYHGRYYYGYPYVAPYPYPYAYDYPYAYPNPVPTPVLPQYPPYSHACRVHCDNDYQICVDHDGGPRHCGNEFHRCMADCQ